MKSRRTAPPAEPRTSRSTVEVRPSWLEDVPEDEAGRRSRAAKPRPSDPRVTIEVQPEWLEAGSRPPSAPGPEPKPKTARKVVPPPLPLEPPVDDEPGRSAIPPPLPPAGKKSRR
ncbi:MAG TPA: hypothetical protein VHB21_21065 [Minicystis sp.]|nr:hypothetical protein [Minicystis sp.]